MRPALPPGPPARCWSWRAPRRAASRSRFETHSFYSGIVGSACPRYRSWLVGDAIRRRWARSADKPRDRDDREEVWQHLKELRGHARALKHDLQSGEEREEH